MDVCYSSHCCDQVPDKKWLKGRSCSVWFMAWGDAANCDKESTVASCSMDVKMGNNLLYHRGSGAQS